MPDSPEPKRNKWILPTMVIGIPVTAVVIAVMVSLGNIFGPDTKFGFSLGDYIGFNYVRNHTTGAFPRSNYLGYSFWVSTGYCKQFPLTEPSGRVQWEVSKVVTGLTLENGETQLKKNTSFVGVNVIHTPSCS